MEVGYNDLARFKRISELLQISLRRLNLSWSHHFELSSIKQLKEVKGKLTLSDIPDMDKIQEFLSMAEKDNLSIRDLRELINQYKRRQQEENKGPRFPQGLIKIVTIL